MRLRDQVEIIEGTETYDPYGDPVTTWDPPTVVTTLPAYVGTVTTEAYQDATRTAYIETLRVIIGPYPFDPNTQRIRWQGTSYTNDGAPLVRRRNGADHHLTIPVRVVT